VPKSPAKIDFFCFLFSFLQINIAKSDVYLRGGGSEDAVLRFEEGDALHQLGDAFFKHFHLFPNGEHQVTLHKVHRLLDLVIDGHRAAPRGTVKNQSRN